MTSPQGFHKHWYKNWGGVNLYKEIAKKMGVSDHTIHAHVRKIYQKMQVRSRAQAVAVSIGRS